MCLKRYGRDAAANAAQMGEAAAGSRPWLAAAVALGEQQLLQQLKKGAVQLLMEAKARVAGGGWRIAPPAEPAVLHVHVHMCAGAGVGATALGGGSLMLARVRGCAG